MEKVLKSVMEAHQTELDAMERRQNANYIAMQEQIKLLEEKNKKLSSEKEALHLEKTASRKQAVPFEKNRQEHNLECQSQFEKSNARLNAVAKVERLSGLLASRLDEILTGGFGLESHAEDEESLENYSENEKKDDNLVKLVECYRCHDEFQPAAERLPIKLKHITEQMCPFCAENLLAMRVSFQTLCIP